MTQTDLIALGFLMYLVTEDRIAYPRWFDLTFEDYTGTF